jgi:putative transposase
MPRMARIVIPDVPHHVTQRGNRREDVFFDDEDRRRYLLLLLEYSQKRALDILAYCLMTNHVHFVAVPRGPDSLARTFKPVDMRYSQHVNRRLHTTGHLWQGQIRGRFPYYFVAGPLGRGRMSPCPVWRES